VTGTVPSTFSGSTRPPAVYIMILPGMAIISRGHPGLLRKKPIFGSRPSPVEPGHRIRGLSGVGIICSSSGQSQLASAIFSFLTFLVAVPSGVRSGTGSPPCTKGPFHFRRPDLRVMFLVLFASAGSRAFSSARCPSTCSCTTPIRVAHFHFVMSGGNVYRLPGWRSLLVAQDLRAHYSEKAARLAGGAGCSSGQLDVPVAVPAGEPRDAPALLQLRSTVPAACMCCPTVGSWVLAWACS